MIEAKTFYILKNIKNIFFVVLLISWYVLMIILANQLFFTEEKMQSINLLRKFLKNMNIAKKNILIKVLLCL